MRVRIRRGRCIRVSVCTGLTIRIRRRCRVGVAVGGWLSVRVRRGGSIRVAVGRRRLCIRVRRGGSIRVAVGRRLCIRIAGVTVPRFIATRVGRSRRSVVVVRGIRIGSRTGRVAIRILRTAAVSIGRVVARRLVIGITRSVGRRIGVGFPISLTCACIAVAVHSAGLHRETITRVIHGAFGIPISLATYGSNRRCIGQTAWDGSLITGGGHG